MFSQSFDFRTNEMMYEVKGRDVFYVSFLIAMKLVLR